MESTHYYPWRLTKWFNDTFGTPLQLEFRYISTVQVPLIPGMSIPSNKTINQYGWIGSSGQLTHYIIKAEQTNPNSPIYHPTAMGKFDSQQSDFLPITFSLLSIDTVDGQSGVVTCTREDINTHTRRTLAFSDELSVKADLSALDLKQDKLTDEQMANVNTKCLPLNLSDNTTISGNYYLDFNCVPRFNRETIFNGTAEMAQANIVNYDLDEAVMMRCPSRSTLAFRDSYNATATLPI